MIQATLGSPALQRAAVLRTVGGGGGVNRGCVCEGRGVYGWIGDCGGGGGVNRGCVERGVYGWIGGIYG